MFQFVFVEKNKYIRKQAIIRINNANIAWNKSLKKNLLIFFYEMFDDIKYKWSISLSNYVLHNFSDAVLNELEIFPPFH